MLVTFRTQGLQSLEQVRAFLEGAQPLGLGALIAPLAPPPRAASAHAGVGRADFTEKDPRRRCTVARDTPSAQQRGTGPLACQGLRRGGRQSANFSGCESVRRIGSACGRLFHNGCYRIDAYPG